MKNFCIRYLVFLVSCSFLLIRLVVSIWSFPSLYGFLTASLSVISAVLLSLCLQRVYNVVRDSEKTAAWNIIVLLLLGIFLFYNATYTGVIYANHEAVTMFFLLAVALVVFYRQSWLALLFCAFAIAISADFATKYLPWVAFLAWFCARNPGGNEKAAKQEKNVRWKHSVPALLMLIAVIVVGLLQMVIPKAIDPLTLNGLTHLALTILILSPFMLIPYYVGIRALRNYKNKQEKKTQLVLLLTPLLIVIFTYFTSSDSIYGVIPAAIVAMMMSLAVLLLQLFYADGAKIEAVRKSQWLIFGVVLFGFSYIAFFVNFLEPSLRFIHYLR